jgi:hypothetical protein
MNADRDLERRISDLYAIEGHVRAPDRVLEGALATIDTTRQRRPIIGTPWRLRIMNFYGKFAIAAVAVVAIAAVGFAILRPSGTMPASVGATGQVSPSPSVAVSARPSPTPSPSPAIVSGSATSFVLPEADSPNNGQLLEPGTWRLSAGFPVPVSFDVPDGWAVCSGSSVEQGLCGPEGTNGEHAGISFLIVENVVSDPCGDALADPPVGPSVNDLVTAISNLKGFRATRPVSVTIDGYRGKQFELTAPDSSACGLNTWATANRTNGVGLSEVNVLQIVDVDGVRIMIAGAYFPTAGDSAIRAQIDAFLATVHITR